MRVLSGQRFAVRIAVSLIRATMAAFMVTQGTQFLVYTTDISDLLLNAVALEFVINTDELLYEALAPSRAKRLLQNTSGFKLKPQPTVGGVDFRGVLTIGFVISGMVWAATAFMKEQLSVLWAVRYAICGGDTEFIFALDGVGSIAWGYPASALDGIRLNMSEFVPNGNWRIDPDEPLPFQELILNSILVGAGNPRVECPAEACYVGIPPSPIPLLPGGSFQPVRPACCLVQQTRVPDISGGKFSLATKGAETPEEATDYWNPGCADTLDVVAYYINLLQGAIGETLRRRQRLQGDLRPCGGVCTAEQPVCRLVRTPNNSTAHPDFIEGGFMAGTTCRDTPSTDLVACPQFDTGYSCTSPVCADAIPFCADSSPIGLRARQICSQTCGCHLPHSTLALNQPSSGCPRRCREIGEYRNSMIATPCVDVAKDDHAYVGFLDNWRDNAQFWPKDWKESSIIWVDLFRRYGCNYLNINTPADDPTVPYTQTSNTTFVLTPTEDNPTGTFWPPNFAGTEWGVNPCVE